MPGVVETEHLDVFCASNTYIPLTNFGLQITLSKRLRRTNSKIEELQKYTTIQVIQNTQIVIGMILPFSIFTVLLNVHN